MQSSSERSFSPTLFTPFGNIGNWRTKKPLTLQGSDYAQAVQETEQAVDRAEGLLLQ
jgi:hypothetical protein